MAIIKGSKLRDVLNGTAQDDEYYGFESNDVLMHSGGNDRFDGGAGIDTVDYSTVLSAQPFGAGVVVDLERGMGTDGTGGRDSYVDVENVVGSMFRDDIAGNSLANVLDGGRGNDVISGRDGDDTLRGGEGSDTLSGDAGEDTLSGGDGNDTMRGGAGNDTFIDDTGADTFDGGAGIDTVDYSGADEGVFASFVPIALASPTDTYHSIENLRGSAFGDWLFGDVNVNTITGAAGDDTIEGGGGADNLDGGTGADSLSYRRSAAGVYVDLGTNTASGGDATGDTIANFESVIGSAHADVLVGSAGDNAISGLGGGDFLFGNAGLDVVTGGAGNDTMYGGADADAFVFDRGVLRNQEGADVIADFELGVDRIEFRPLSATAIGAEGMTFDDLQFFQDGANTVIYYDHYYYSAPSMITLVGIDMDQLLAHAGSTFLFS
jgi:Ca2+-binding RTX toxin-like protein